MKKYSLYLILALLLVITLSCNLDGSGLFLSMGRAVATEDTDMSDLTVHRILNLDSGTSTMFLLTGNSIKFKDLSDADASWEDTPITEGSVNDAVYDGSAYYLALRDSTGAVSVYSAAELSTDTATASSLTAVPNLSDITLSALLYDSANAYALIYDSGAVKLWSSDTDTFETIISDAGKPASALSFAIEDTSSTHFFINVFDTSSDSYGTYYCSYNKTNFTEVTSPTLVDNPAVTEHLIGGTIHNGYMYLYTNDGDVLKIATGDIGTNPTDPFDGISSIFASDDDHLKLSQNSSGYDIARIGGIPSVLVQRDGDTDYYLLVAGDEVLFELNLTEAESATITPVEVDAVADNYYYKLSNSRITDFYDEDSSDWAFYTATSDSWVLKTTGEESSSEILQ